MAVTRDILETVFVITGATEYIASSAAAAASTGLLAQAQTAWNASLEVTAGLLSLINPALVGITVALAGVAAAVALVTRGLAEFSKEAKVIFETGVILKNLGSTLTLPQVQQYAQSTSQATGISRPEIIGTAGVLARTGVSGEQIRDSLKTIGDTARATGKSFSEVGEAIEKGILGRTRPLAQFGIVLQDTGSKAANFALIMKQLELRYAGAAEAFSETLPGAIETFNQSLQRFFKALGEQFAPAVVAVLTALATGIDFLTAHIVQLAEVIAFVVGGLPALLGVQAAAGGTREDPLAKVGKGGEPATEATALQIADNTRLIADAVEQQVLGGTGEVVRQQFGYLHARIAMNI